MANYMRHTLRVSQTTGTTAVNANYSNARTHDLSASRPPFVVGPFWVGVLDTLNVHVHAIAGATKLTVRVTADAAGNEAILPDTEAAISVGIGAATTGSTAYSAGVAITNLNPTQGDSRIYVWVKTDAGTCNVKETTLSWRE